MRKIFLIIKYLKQSLNIKNVLKAHNEIIRYSNQNDIGIPIKDKESWKKNFFKFIVIKPDCYMVAEAFFRSLITCEKYVAFDNRKPILITIEKNELYRIKKFLTHYRNIGIDQFAFIDNDSDPYIIEYLKKQTDVCLFSVKDTYTTERREGWINRILSFYGYNRWYCVVDIDELLVYDEYEKHSIDEFINQLEMKKIKRIRGMLIDMYGEALFDTTLHGNQYENLKYFDCNGYTFESTLELEVVRGGFRNRVFNINPLLTKYPIFFFEKGDIHGKSHFLFPFYKNLNTECYIGLLHYKFLASDYKKYLEISKKGNFSQGSTQYKDYIESYIRSGEKMRLKSDNSVELKTSKDLIDYKLIKKVKWRSF